MLFRSDRLKVSEAGRLQTFPADYPWSGKDVSQQIGNAIPPRLAAHVLAAALGRELAPGFLDTMARTRWIAIDSETIKAARHTEHAHGCPAPGEKADFDPALDLRTRELMRVAKNISRSLDATTSGVLSM